MRFSGHFLAAILFSYLAGIYTFGKYSFKKADPLLIDFTQPQNANIDFQGFGAPESWGRWSEGDRSIVTLRRFLPENFRLVLTLQGFGPNVHKAMKIKLGSQEQEIQVPEAMQSFSLEFKSVEFWANRIQFFIPNPTSPQDLNLSPDTRKLGIGVKELHIEVI